MLQIVLIYSYTKDTPGLQSALDSVGIPTGEPASFVIQKKLLLLFWIQVGWFVTCASLARGWVATSFMGHSFKIE